MEMVIRVTPPITAAAPITAYNPGVTHRVVVPQDATNNAESAYVLQRSQIAYLDFDMNPLETQQAVSKDYLQHLKSQEESPVVRWLNFSRQQRA